MCGVAAYFDREFMSRSPTCHSRKAPSDLVAIHEGLEAYALDHDGTYPATLAALVTPDEQGHSYLDQSRLPRDPWNREYVFVPGNPPDVLTYGRDGVQGGTGEDADNDCLTIANRR